MPLLTTFTPAEGAGAAAGAASTRAPARQTESDRGGARTERLAAVGAELGLAGAAAAGAVLGHGDLDSGEARRERDAQRMQARVPAWAEQRVARRTRPPILHRMARPVSVRVRHHRGALQLTGLDPSTTLEQLKQTIAQRLELPKGQSFHRACAPPPCTGTPPYLMRKCSEALRHASSRLLRLRRSRNSSSLEVSRRLMFPAHSILTAESLLVQEYAAAAPVAAPPVPAPEPKPAPAKSAASTSTAEARKPAEPPLVVGNDEEGYLVRRIVDSDNSCLFTSIGCDES